MLIDCWLNVINVFDLSSCFVCVVSHSGMCECICEIFFLTVLVHVMYVCVPLMPLQIFLIFFCVCVYLFPVWLVQYVCLCACVHVCMCVCKRERVLGC